MASEPSTPPRRVEPEMIVAVAAVFVGVCALGVSLYQASIMRDQQRELSEQRRAEVWPNLEFGKGEYDDAVHLILVNTGIGPARIETVRLTHKETPITNWSELLDRITNHGSYSYTQSQMNGRVLPANEQIDALVLSDELVDSLEASFLHMSIAFCYCSIYNECWQYELNFSGATTRDSVTKCEAKDTDFKQ